MSHGNMARPVTLLNLCCVLIVANLLFLFGLEQTQSKVKQENEDYSYGATIVKLFLFCLNCLYAMMQLSGSQKQVFYIEICFH